MHDLSLYLSPAEYIDSDHAAVIAHAKAVTAGVSDATEKARRLYLAVRDGIRYAPYVDYTNAETFRASSVLVAGQGYCVGKASLYAALCRATGIPARIGLADVKNHLATPKLLEEVGTTSSPSTAIPSFSSASPGSRRRRPLTRRSAGNWA